MFCTPKVLSAMVGMRRGSGKSADFCYGKLEGGGTGNCPFQDDTHVNYSSDFISHLMEKLLLKTRSLEKTSFN